MSVYQNIYELLQGLVFSETMTNAEEIACTMLSTIAAIFVVIIPFIIVWKCIKLILE